jgi:hypothetical protein
VWDTVSRLLPSMATLSDFVGKAGDRFDFAASVAESLRGALDLNKVGADLATVPFRLVATMLEAIGDKIKSIVDATKGVGVMAGILKVFDSKRMLRCW